MSSSTSAGRLLREARERQGLHVAALAASIKVAPRKLELLEADRIDALPDATFARALAQTVCRALKIDPAPVLRQLPPPAGYRLEQLGEGLNTPFHARADGEHERGPRSWIASPVVWVTVLILLAALAVYLLPPGTLRVVSSRDGATRPAPAALGAQEATATPAAVSAGEATAASAIERATALPVVATPTSAQAAPTADAGSLSPGVLQVRTSAESWVEVTDSSGRVLLSRIVRPDESVSVDGVLPFKVRIGNAARTRLVFRGQPTELAAYTRDNIARLELK